MVSYVLGAGFVSLALYALNLGRQWRKHYLIAKTSGFTVFPVPVYVFTAWWLVFHRKVLAALRLVPREWRPRWVDQVAPHHTLYAQYASFEGAEDDTYLTVAPGGIMLWTANPELINQITTRRTDFPKPTFMYKILNLYGRNIISAEGHSWRHQRKITSPSFTERNNQLVWTESIRQTELMMKSWMGHNSRESRTVTTMATDIMRLGMHVIVYAGFGIKWFWPGVEDGEASDAEVLSKGHTMTAMDALETLLHDIMMAVVLGPKILGMVFIATDKDSAHTSTAWLPFKRHQKLYTAYAEWGNYMKEIIADKRAQLAVGGGDGDMDLMAALVESAQSSNETKPSNYSAPHISAAPSVTDEEIMGNAFVFILAGHETTANAIHFALIYLALDVSSQRKLQAELDAIFHGRSPDQWNYERDLPKLINGMAGAVLNEILRLVPPIVGIPKWAYTPQSLAVSGTRSDGRPKRFTVPEGTMVNLASTAVHRNPKYWPHGPPSDPSRPAHPYSNLDNDLEEFRPERWLQPKDQAHGVAAATPDSDAWAKIDYFSTDAPCEDPSDGLSSSLYRPPDGAYIPFSYGHRSCLGRRFGQVEVLVAIATIFYTHSVELAVDGWAGDEEVASMGSEEKRSVWEKAGDATQKMLRENVYSELTLQLRDGKKIPIRLVKRGCERFDWT